ncbi:MAG: PqqD family protein [Caldilineales bacterium]|nr:PqqD family protein [Caldilineales bacterium]
MNSSSSYRVNSPHVIHEIFEDGEAALINLKSGAYYSLDPIGAEIWALIDQGYSLGDVVEIVMQRYDGSLAQIINDANDLVTGLLEEDLIVVSADNTGKPSLPPAPDGGKKPYTSPRFERFDDMQELLLLDPIHDVGEQGWPHAKSDDA